MSQLTCKKKKWTGGREDVVGEDICPGREAYHGGGRSAGAADVTMGLTTRQQQMAARVR
jgi:hypothetical protein